jgi:hypothetical protein
VKNVTDLNCKPHKDRIYALLVSLQQAWKLILPLVKKWPIYKHLVQKAAYLANLQAV